MAKSGPPHVIIDGQVDGDIHAFERLELGAQARVKGNLHYGLIETAMGGGRSRAACAR